MRRTVFSYFFIVVGVLSLYPQTVAKNKQPLRLNIQTKSENGKIMRTPIYLPIEAWYDTEEMTVEIKADKDLEGEATLTWNNIIVGYSIELTTVFSMPYDYGTYTLTIESDSWSAEGSFKL